MLYDARKHFGARGNGRRDDTDFLQAALDAMDGDELFIPEGVYVVTRSLNIRSERGWRIKGEPGTVLEWRGVGPMLSAAADFHTDTIKRIECLTLLGPQKKVAPESVGLNVGLSLYRSHSTILDGLRIHGFDGAGLKLTESYRCDIRSINAQFNGYGVDCRTANSTTFTQLSATYNIYGTRNVQSMVGGCIEGNSRSGAVYNEVGTRYALHDVWFEQNNLANVPGESDILANDPSGDWNPVVLSISGCTTFHNSYSDPATDERKVPTHNIKGCLHLATSGAIRFFHPNKWHSFAMHPWSTITDGAAGNAMIDVTNGFSGPVNYVRPVVRKL